MAKEYDYDSELSEDETASKPKSSAKAKPEVSDLDGLSLADIFNPKPYKYHYGSLVIEIAPMQDGDLMEVSEDLDAVVELVLDTITYNDKGEVELTGLLASLPKVFKTAYPKIARILAQSLKRSPEEIARVPLAHKLGLFQGVLEAENIPLLLKNGEGLFSLLPEKTVSPIPGEEAQQTEMVLS